MKHNFAEAIQALPSEIKPQAAPGIWERVFEMLPVTGRALNAGAGRGGMSMLLAKLGLDVVSIDLHPEHFRVPGMTCSYCDLHEPLPFAEGDFDAVIAVEVLEHLENPWRFFREAIRVLRPGGVFVCTSPNVESLFSRIEMLRGRTFPYFREQSFQGCYHVTPIFEWSIRRCCRTAQACVKSVSYSRVGWPDGDDVPRHHAPKFLGSLWKVLPRNRLFGEVSIYQVLKNENALPALEVGRHSP